MNKINWVQKLSSRKFWLAIIGFVVALLTALNINALTIEQVTAIIGGVGALIAYILAEGYVDGKREETKIIVEEGDILDD